MQGRLPHIICRAVLGRCGGSRGFRRTSVQPGSWTERKVVSGRRAGRPVWTALIASTGLKALSIRTTGDDISSLAGPRRCGGEFCGCGDGGMPHFRLCSKLRSCPRLLRCFRTERNDVSCIIGLELASNSLPVPSAERLRKSLFFHVRSASSKRFVLSTVCILASKGRGLIVVCKRVCRGTAAFEYLIIRKCVLLPSGTGAPAAMSFRDGYV
mmetsp:Transcript_79905/g.191913  ORF Transcript_79905/g.191913 Transcript_79905/m.191913 type:complete len:212 (+) Transcript_79905:627-1262(+)